MEAIPISHSLFSSLFSSLCRWYVSTALSRTTTIYTASLVLYTPDIPERLDGNRSYRTILPKLALLLRHTTTTK